MASNSKRENECFLFKPNRPLFFKIIFQATVTDGKLCLPRKFVRNHGNDLSNPVFLEVPTDAKWKVELVKCDGEVWLQNGWKEFAKYYSVSHGSFLVFEYDSGCHFNVLIFDESATEIDYPFSLINGNEDPHRDGEFQEPKMEETEDDVSVEIIDDISPCRKSKEKLSFPCPRPHKMMKTNFTSSKFESTSNVKTSVSPTDAHSVRINQRNFTRKVNAHCSGQHFEALRGNRFLPNQKQKLDESIRREQPLTADEKANALHRAAAAFRSRNPFFMVAMQPSYVLPGNTLIIPYKFAKSYFKEKRGHVMLKVSDRRTWSVEYACDVFNGQPKAKFLCSWKEFVLDNNLEVGDVCVFELIKGIRISLQVSIFRMIEDASWSEPLIHLIGANQVKPIKSLVGKVVSGCNNKEEVELSCPHCNEDASWSKPLIHLRGANQVKPIKSLVAKVVSGCNKKGEVELSCPHCNEDASWSQPLTHLRGANQVKPIKSLVAKVESGCNNKEEVEVSCPHCNEYITQELPTS